MGLSYETELEVLAIEARWYAETIPTGDHWA